MKKIPIILSALLLSAMSAAAGETALRLSLRDGSSATYVLSDRPVISFSGEQMMIECDNASTAYNRSEVTSLAFFTKGTTGIADAAMTADVLSYVGGELSAPGCAIEVYTIAGVRVAAAFGNLSDSILAPGAYIVRAGRQTLKIVIR